MRIAYFTESLPPVMDGVSGTMSYLHRSLLSENIDHIFFSPFAPDPQKWAGNVVKITSIPFPLYRYYRLSLPAFHDLRTFVEKFHPDLIHIVSPFLLGMSAYKLAAECGVPVVNSYHTSYVSYLKYYGFGWMENRGWQYMKWFYNRGAMSLVPSNATIAELDGRGFKNLALWERGIDVSRFSPRFKDYSLRKYWSPDGRPIALFVGRLVREKDIDILIRAYWILKERNIPFKLVFVGDGPMRDEIAKALPDCVLAGFLSGTDLSCAYASADMFVFPSTTETFGNVIIEAGASGIPSVGASEGGVKNLIVNGETGYLARPHDPVDFAMKMEFLLKYSNLREQFAINALKFALSKSWENINKGLLKNYESIIRQKQDAKIVNSRLEGISSVRVVSNVEKSN